MGTKNGGVRVRVTRKNLNDDYLMCPNDLLRGHGIYAELSPHERILLGAGLSCADGWETTLDEIESWVPDLGRDRQEAVRRSLREQGFLTQTRSRIPAGRPGAGQFEWSFAFYMEPLPDGERDDLPTKKSSRKRPGRTVPGFSGHGEPVEDDAKDDAEETAGQTVPGFSGHGGSGHGQPGPGEDPLYKEEKNHSEKDQNPPTPPPSEPAASAVVEAATNGGDDSNLDDETRGLLNALVDQVAVDRGWEPTKIRAAIRAALDAKWSPEQVVSGLADIADDLNTVGPGRLVSYLGVRQAKRAVQVAAADDAPAPLRVLGRDTPRCRVSGHETELASNCVQCKTARLVDDGAAPAVTMDRQSAIAAAKAAALPTRRAPSSRQLVAQQAARPTGLDRLNAAAQELGAAESVFANAG